VRNGKKDPVRNIKGKNLSSDLSVSRRIILNWNLKNIILRFEQN
jgi:hypothetical protein